MSLLPTDIDMETSPEFEARVEEKFVEEIAGFCSSDISCRETFLLPGKYTSLKIQSKKIIIINICIIKITKLIVLLFLFKNFKTSARHYFENSG